MPDFLIVGAARSATTSLHHYLTGHPHVAMSRTKEPNYFLFEQQSGTPVALIEPDGRLLAKSVTERDAYERLFVTGSGEKVVAGEASPLYLYVRETPALIAEAIPDVKLIAVLRDPIERALSHYGSIHQAAGDGDLAAFCQAVETELDVPGYTPYATGTHLLRLGRYGEQLTRYLEYFSSEQLLVLDFREVASDPANALTRICKFIDVDPSHDFGQLIAYNGSRPVQNRLAQKVRGPLARAQPWLKGTLPPRLVAPLAKLRARISRPADHPTLPTDLHRRLLDYYRPDVDQLRPLVDFDVDRWLEPT